MNEESTENLVEAAKEENLEVKVVVIGSLPGFVSLADILEEQVSRAEIDGFRCTKIDNPHDLAMICSSSGTTGMSKGTELSYASLYNSITPVEEVHAKNEICVWISTIRWHYGLTLCIEVVMSNAKWIIFSDDNLSEIELCEIIQKYGVSRGGEFSNLICEVQSHFTDINFSRSIASIESNKSVINNLNIS